MQEALAYGLSVVREKIDEDLASIGIEVSCEMLAGEVIMRWVDEAGFQVPAVNFI